MFGPKLLNRDEIRRVWLKLQKRKGKPIALADIKEGDIFQFEGDQFPQIFLIVEEDEYDATTYKPTGRKTKVGEVRDAHEYLLPFSMVSCVSRSPLPMQWLPTLPPARRLGNVSEFPARRFEPVLTTLVYHNPDGTVCCQNFITIGLGGAGQHFKLSRGEYAKLRRRDRLERKWKPAKSACTCTLKAGQVREHDGRIWHHDARDKALPRHPGESGRRTNGGAHGLVCPKDPEHFAERDGREPALITGERRCPVCRTELVEANARARVPQ